MSTAERSVGTTLLSERLRNKELTRVRISAPTDRAWRSVGWFGLLLAVVGLGDVVLVWPPAAFGNATWEFGAVDMSFTSLPLLTMGLAALLASAFAPAITLAFAYDRGTVDPARCGVAPSLRCLLRAEHPSGDAATPPEMKVGIWKSIAKTTMLGILFPLAYLMAGLAALRNYSLEGESREV